MRVLVVGSGGREHALCWKLAASPLCGALFCAPGNPGIAAEATCVPVAAGDLDGILDLCRRERLDFVVVGPEAPLVAGLADRLEAAGIRTFGPSAAAAMLEGSKGFMKDLCAKYGIPTAAYGRFRDITAAKAFVRRQGAPIVVKADGLAAGKGVTVAMTMDEAVAAIDAAMVERRFGSAGAELVIEEFLAGEEASFLALVDGRNAVPLASAQDHKRVGDGDTGPNTGGMGAYSPAPVVTPNVHQRVMHEIILPTVEGMAKDGIVFTGFLYAGLMIDANGHPKTLEFNTRMGDPETQPIMMRLKSDLAEVLMHATDGTLDQVELQWDRRVALGVVMAAAGYPETPRKGDRITGLPAEAEDAVVFHAGTALQGDVTSVTGGRVLCVTGLGDSTRTAQQRAYETLRGIHFDGEQHRTDIGHRAIHKR